MDEALKTGRANVETCSSPSKPRAGRMLIQWMSVMPGTYGDSQTGFGRISLSESVIAYLKSSQRIPFQPYGSNTLIIYPIMTRKQIDSCIRRTRISSSATLARSLRESKKLRLGYDPSSLAQALPEQSFSDSQRQPIVVWCARAEARVPG